MVDLHAHILPEIDDGAKNLEESLAMCKLAYQDGIRTIVATPHVGKFPNTKETILNKISELKQNIISNQIELNLLPGADVEFHPGIFALIEDKSILTINNSRYLLLDIPFLLLPPNMEKLLEQIINKGIIPIISHPERCLQIQEEPGILYNLVKLGALVQITASSITGKMGPKPKQTAHFVLKHNLAHIIATDTHGINNRPPILSEAAKLASSIVGKEAALSMATTTPQCIIENKLVGIPEPKKIK